MVTSHRLHTKESKQTSKTNMLMHYWSNKPCYHTSSKYKEKSAKDPTSSTLTNVIKYFNILEELKRPIRDVTCLILQDTRSRLYLLTYIILKVL